MAEEMQARIVRLTRRDDDGPSGAVNPYGIAYGASVWFIGFLIYYLVTGHL